MDSSCPKCGFSREVDAIDCPACGIVYARYSPPSSTLSTAPRATSAAPPPGAPPPLEPEGWSPLQESPPTPPGFVENSNPYAAPQALVVESGPVYQGNQLPQAGRLTRLAARMLDGLIVGAVGVFAALVIPSVGESGQLFGGLLFVGFLLGIIIYNLVLLDRAGQTIGKKALGIRIVRLNGDRVSLGRLLGYRWFLVMAISIVPVVGTIFSVVNALFIFGNEQRCIHDYLADTKVVVE